MFVHVVEFATPVRFASDGRREKAEGRAKAGWLQMQRTRTTTTRTRNLKKRLRPVTTKRLKQDHGLWRARAPISGQLPARGSRRPRGQTRGWKAAVRPTLPVAARPTMLRTAVKRPSPVQAAKKKTPGPVHLLSPKIRQRRLKSHRPKWPRTRSMEQAIATFASRRYRWRGDRELATCQIPGPPSLLPLEPK
jgi:hypothetical protein